MKLAIESELTIDDLKKYGEYHLHISNDTLANAVVTLESIV